MVVPAVVPFELSAATQHLTRQLEGNPALDAQTSQEKIAKRIQELGQEICVPRGYHNTTTPICRLPPEILSATFELLLTESAQIYVPYRTRLSADVVRVTHVCRHWRQVALDCTPLWDNLDFAFPALTHAMLDRSKDAPLTLRYNMISAPKTAHNFLGVLRRLRIEARPIDDLLVSYVQNLPWRELPLYDPTVLKKLALYAAPGSTGHRPSPAQLRQALITMPRLEALRLGSFLPLKDPGDDGSPAAPPITLSNLRYMSLTDGLPQLTCFLRNARIPAGVSLRLDISQTNGREESIPFPNITHLISKIQLFYGNTSQVRTPVGELVISESHYEIYPIASPGNNFDSPLTLALTDSVGVHIATHYWDSFATILDFSTLASLLVLFGFRPIGTWHKDAWNRLGQAPNLKVITFQKSHFHGFLGALGQQGLFPSLSTIRFVSVNPAEDDVDVHGFIGRLISALNGRVESGNPVKRLWLMKMSGLHEEDVRRIQEGVPSLEVAWDGYTSYAPPSEWGEDDEYNWGDPEGEDIPPSSS